MKASKLLQYLQILENSNKLLFDNLTVHVKINTGNSTIGATPTIKVGSINLGIDWDSGKLMLYPESPLFLKKDL